jgi:2-polyprenyl-3-methyl-5-hydroxy-6-metoxy-1,4-benzoquinol methylase
VHPTGVPAGVPDDYYDRIYEAERAHWWHRGMRATEATLLGDRIRPGLHILDAGCGTGGFCGGPWTRFSRAGCVG